MPPSNPNPSLARSIQRIYDQLPNKDLESWGQLAKKEWSRNLPGMVAKLVKAGGQELLNQAAVIAQEQAMDLYSSLLQGKMDPNEAREQAIQQVLLGFDPEALEPSTLNRPTQETTE
jgi:hypothetical protein